MSSIVGSSSTMNGSSSSSSSSSSGFVEFKKHASFFLKEKIKTARLTFTDVTPAQLVVEEATNGSPVGPDAIALKTLSRAAFEVDDYWRIVDILHKRFVRFDETNWRSSYKALIVLEHLLTHGPDRVSEEFQDDSPAIRRMETFQHVDHQGFNWGLNVKKKCERVLKLLERGPLLKEERDRARKVSRGIQGFGSFTHRTSSSTPAVDNPFTRSISEFHHQQDSNEGICLLLEEQNQKHNSSEVLQQHLHPFDETDRLTAMSSLLSTADEP